MPRNYASTRKTPEVAYRKRNFDEEKLLRRRIGVVISLTISIFVLLYFFGIPFVRFIGLLGQRLRSDDNTLVTKTAEPPMTPRLDYIPNYVNKNKLEVKGVTDPQVQVTLTVNGKDSLQAQSDENGIFDFLNVSIKEGANNLRVVATREGKSSSEISVNVTFDKTPPPLEVKEPADNAFYPKNTQTIKVSGKTEVDATVDVNELQAIVDREGNFSFDLPVVGGEQKVKIIAKDIAGNQKVIEKSIKVDSDAKPSPSPSG